MTRNSFWQLIDESLSGFNAAQPDGNMDRQAERLRQLLAGLAAEEIVSFNEHFRALMVDAYRWDLWAAAHVLGGGCSDDYFSYFRAWLISRGRIVYEGVCADPESLAEYERAPGVEDIFFEDFPYAIAEAYEQATGRDLPDPTAVEPDRPTGERWEDDESLRARFPALWKQRRL
jgi:hypothetical protein